MEFEGFSPKTRDSLLPCLVFFLRGRPSCIPSSYEVEFEVNKVLLTTKPEPVQTLYLGVAVDIGVAPAVDPAAKIEYQS